MTPRSSPRAPVRDAPSRGRGDHRRPSKPEPPRGDPSARLSACPRCVLIAQELSSLDPTPALPPKLARARLSTPAMRVDQRCVRPMSAHSLVTNRAPCVRSATGSHRVPLRARVGAVRGPFHDVLPRFGDPLVASTSASSTAPSAPSRATCDAPVAPRDRRSECPPRRLEVPRPPRSAARECDVATSARSAFALCRRSIARHDDGQCNPKRDQVAPVVLDSSHAITSNRFDSARRRTALVTRCFRPRARRRGDLGAPSPAAAFARRAGGQRSTASDAHPSSASQRRGRLTPLRAVGDEDHGREAVSPRVHRDLHSRAPRAARRSRDTESRSRDPLSRIGEPRLASLGHPLSPPRRRAASEPDARPPKGRRSPRSAMRALPCGRRVTASESRPAKGENLATIEVPSVRPDGTTMEDRSSLAVHRPLRACTR